MKIYNKKDKCPKCDGEVLKDKFVSKEMTFGSYSLVDKDIIERTCLNCGYKFNVYPLDYKDNVVEK